MAGSPGSGKTETAGRLSELEETPPLIHIDQDEIKVMLPDYSGELSEKYHGAASIGVEKVLDYVIKKELNFILDSTFSSVEKAKNNVERVLKKGFVVEVFFVYQEPEHAWNFIKQREKEEGRKVPKESFVRQFINSRFTVNEIKEQFDKKIKLHFVLKTIEKDGTVKEDYKYDVENVDRYIKKVYSEKELYDLVSE